VIYFFHGCNDSLYFLREHDRHTAAFQNHLVFGGVECKSYSSAEELKSILRRRFERGGAFIARLNKKSSTVPRDVQFFGGAGAGINADSYLARSRVNLAR
jgi:hypothetical protein